MIPQEEKEEEEEEEEEAELTPAQQQEWVVKAVQQANTRREWDDINNSCQMQNIRKRLQKFVDKLIQCSNREDFLVFGEPENFTELHEW